MKEPWRSVRLMWLWGKIGPMYKWTNLNPWTWENIWTYSFSHCYLGYPADMKRINNNRVVLRGQQCLSLLSDYPKGALRVQMLLWLHRVVRKARLLSSCSSAFPTAWSLSHDYSQSLSHKDCICPRGRGDCGGIYPGLGGGTYYFCLHIFRENLVTWPCLPWK